MKKTLLLILATAFFTAVTSLTAAELPSVPDEASLLTEVKLEKEFCYTVSTKWGADEKGNGGHILDVDIAPNESGKGIHSLRILTFGEKHGDWSWGKYDAEDGKITGAVADAWLKHATNLMNRFVISGEFVADKVPWKFIGRAEKLQSYETPYQLLFERNGKYLVLGYHEWLGDEPKKGDMVTLAEYKGTYHDRYFSATISSQGKISVEIGVMEEVASLKKRDELLAKP